MKLEPFQMERMQSTWENVVDYNLSESGVHPLTLQELYEGDNSIVEKLLHQEMVYSQSNGTVELREKIAALYPGSRPENILVTTGTSEANFLTTWRLIEPGDEVALMLPNYMQIRGVSRAFGATVRPFYLREQNEWKPDLDQLRQSVNNHTKMIAVCNPNNPTGAILTEEEMKEIVEIASRYGCWLLADEVYQGAEREKERTKSFWGNYERIIITNGLSKAYGIPGIRIGWIVAPADLIEELWSYHDYTTIGPATLSDIIARKALTPESRQRIAQRTRKILNTNYPILHHWIQQRSDLFTLVPPQAGAIAYLRYHININSTQFVMKLLHDKSVLIVPGDHFGMDHYLRIGYGPPENYLRAALDRIASTLQELA